MLNPVTAQAWKTRLKGAGTVVVTIAVVQMVSTVFFSPAAKTYQQYATEVLSSGVVEQLAHTQTDQIRAQIGSSASAGIDWPAVETAFSVCIRREIMAWLATDDPRIHQNITQRDLPAWARQFSTACIKMVMRFEQDQLVFPEDLRGMVQSDGYLGA